MTTLKTAFLMSLIMILFILVGGALGGQQGMIIAFIFSLAMNFGSYWFSDKIVLAMYKAQPIVESENPKLFAMVQRLSQKANIPMPKVYVIQNPTPNAFATGRNPNHAAVAVTTGIMSMLNENELAGVIAHELAHIKNRDILISSIVATLVGTISFIANMASWAFMFAGRSDDEDNSGGIGGLVLMILSPIIATLIQLAISRSREFAADEGGAAISGEPLSLAGALNKLAYVNERLPMENAQPASAHMFIVNPFSGKSVAKMFSTHPPIEERVNRLQEIAAGRR